MENIKKNELIGKTYFIEPIKLGELTDGFKRRRPIYILDFINEKYVFGVISTTTIHSGQKKTFQRRKYIMWSKKAGLRLSRSDGFAIIKKSDIEKDRSNLNQKIKIDVDNKRRLLDFYSPLIREEKKRLG